MSDLNESGNAAPEPTWPGSNTTEKPHRNPLFFGRFGLRAGYGLAIFVIVWVLGGQVLGSLVGLIASGQAKQVMQARAQQQAHPDGPRQRLHLDFVPSMVTGVDATGMAVMLAICFVFSKAERRPMRYFFLGPNRWTDFFPGALWGVSIMSAVVALLRGMHLLVFDGQADHGGEIFSWGAKWLLAFICVGFAEEYALRGYFLYTLMRGVWGMAERISPQNAQAVAFWIAGTLSSVVFAAMHLGNGGENFFGILQVFLAGMTFVYVVWRTGSLWWAVGFHTTWDWAQSFLFGVADSGNISVGRLFITHPQGKTLLSGGSAGPEGSIFASMALLLTIGLLTFMKRSPLPPPDQLPPTAEPTEPAAGVA